MMKTTAEILQGPDVLDFGDPDKPVSSGSRWADLTWRLDTNDPGYSRDGISVIWWPSRETVQPPSPAELVILHHMKILLWVGLFSPALTFVRKVTGARSIAFACSRLLRFMTEQNLADFSQITSETVDAYLEWIAREIGDREDVGSGEHVIRSVAFQCLLPLVYIWKARKQLAAAGVPIPEVDPMEGRSALKLIRNISKWVITALPPVPEEAFLRIVNAAADIVLVHSRDVLAAQDIWFEHTGGFGTDSSLPHAKRALAAYRCDTVGGSKTPWPRDLPRVQLEIKRAQAWYGDARKPDHVLHELAEIGRERFLQRELDHAVQQAILLKEQRDAAYTSSAATGMLAAALKQQGRAADVDLTRLRRDAEQKAISNRLTSAL